VKDNLDIISPTAIGGRSAMKSPVNAKSDSGPHSSNLATATTGQTDLEATKAYVEQVRLLVLGMEQRLQAREAKLMKTVEYAEGESTKYEEAKKQVSSH
jgi:hypothetical protein